MAPDAGTMTVPNTTNSSLSDAVRASYSVRVNTRNEAVVSSPTE